MAAVPVACSLFIRVHISYMGFGYRWSNYYLTGKALDMKCMDFFPLS